MLIADGGDLNPKMLLRWQAYLSRTRKGHDPVFAPWHALAALPDARVRRRGEEPFVPACRHPRPGTPVNPSVARALADAPPALARGAGQDLWQDPQ